MPSHLSICTVLDEPSSGRHTSLIEAQSLPTRDIASDCLDPDLYESIYFQTHQNRTAILHIVVPIGTIETVADGNSHCMELLSRSGYGYRNWWRNCYNACNYSGIDGCLGCVVTVDTATYPLLATVDFY